MCASLGAVVVLVGACGLAATARAGTWPEYTIQRIGLYGSEQTGSAGLQNSTLQFYGGPAFVAGYSTRYTGVSTSNGRDVWVWNGTTTTQVGFTGAGYALSGGYQSSGIKLQNAAGLVVGYSKRYFGVDSSNGQDAWVSNGTTTTQIGLTGGVYTGSGGFQFSDPELQNAAGHIAGYSTRYTGVSTSNGQDAWAWNGTSTVQLGLTGGPYTGSAGRQRSLAQMQNAAGQVTGYSERYTGISTNNGQDAWVWNGTTTTQIGLTGSGYTSNAGKQFSEPVLQDTSGRIVGYSNRYTGLGSYNGRDSWVWNGTATTQIGLTGAANIGSAGYRESFSESQSDGGQVVGYSNRYSGVSTDNGRDTWVWNGTTTTNIGLTGGANTGSAGYQYSAASFQNAAGQVVGYSNRYTGVSTKIGEDVWVWNGTTTAQIGLTGGVYSTSGGRQSSHAGFQNAAGQVVGGSARYLGETAVNGNDTWVWNGTTSVQIGLTGGANTGSGAYQRSNALFQNEAGQVAGYSERYTGLNTDNGRDAWAWNGTTTTQIGLTGGDNTASTGYQYSLPEIQNTAGQIVGHSARYIGTSTYNGNDAWVWNGTITTRIGLAGGINTGSAGYQYSSLLFQNFAGQVAGYSQRFAGVNTQIGQDAWYFDPNTLLSSAIIGSVRTSDNYAFSVPTILTEGGFLLGYYSFFNGGMDPAVDRAFVFRPDLGFTDLGDLVTGGLTASGWSTLQRPQFADALNTIVGYGYVNGQTTGQSVFVMSIPAPGAAGLLGLCGVLAMRRRRARS